MLHGGVIRLGGMVLGGSTDRGDVTHGDEHRVRHLQVRHVCVVHGYAEQIQGHALAPLRFTRRQGPNCEDMYGAALRTGDQSSARRCRALAAPSRSGTYPPSSTLTTRPPHHCSARDTSARVSSSTSSSSRVKFPSGSPARESKPAEIRTRSGVKPDVAPSTARTNASTYRRRGRPPGSGTFHTLSCGPRSEAAPVPGYHGH